MNNPNQQPLYTGKGKKPAALVRSTKSSQAKEKTVTDPLGILANTKKR